MKHLTDTIRAGLMHRREGEPYLSETPTTAALTALSELERMAGEPVAVHQWRRRLHTEPWRDATKEVAYQRVDEHWEARTLYTAAPVAQQPQARPDFTDEWTGYLKDGETPFERFLRERKDVQSVLRLYQRALEENERLKAHQPQAEPDDEILKERDDAEDFIDMLLDEVLGTDRPEWTSAYGRDDALRDVQERMTALHKPTVDKAWARFEKAQQPQAEPKCECNATTDTFCEVCTEYRKWKQPQAESDIHEAQGQIEFLDRKNNALSAAIRKVMARLADLLDEDQFKEIEETISSAGVQPQAEAVPKRATGWVAPKDRYTTPVLFNPYTGEPRDVRDVQSDPQGVLIVPHGALMLAAKKGGA